MTDAGGEPYKALRTALQGKCHLIGSTRVARFLRTDGVGGSDAERDSETGPSRSAIPPTGSVELSRLGTIGRVPRLVFAQPAITLAHHMWSQPGSFSVALGRVMRP